MANFIAKAPVRRLMKQVGAYIVAADAVESLIDHLEKSAKEITRRSMENASDNGRKTVNAGDIMVASRS